MGKILKIYAWLSAILIAFFASYLTAVLSEIVPPPKHLLCKLSLGFCPPPIIVSFNATDIDRIVDRDGVGQGTGQNQIGMLHNRTDPNGERSNMVKYRFDATSSGEFVLRIFYAAYTPRPVEIFVNDNKIASNALAESTGGWDNKDRLWSAKYKVTLKSENNTLMLKRNSIFPHLSKFELTQVY